MPRDRPNVLFLLSDQHNYRCLSRLDSALAEPVHTPTLDELAANGTVFEQTYCQSPLCAPSRMSMLTGRTVPRCGGLNNHSVLRPGLRTLPAAFSDAGYETCLVGKMHLGGTRQFVGFDHRPYGDLTGGAGHQHEPLVGSLNVTKGLGKDTAPVVYDRDWRKRQLTTVGETEFPESTLQETVVLRESLAFLREHANRAPETPWLLCASFSRPHPPFTAPPRHLERYWPDGVTDPRTPETSQFPLSSRLADWYEVDSLSTAEIRKARAAYFACVDYLDELLGELLVLLEAAGFLENTIVVYTSDHGEMMGEHGLFEKRTWYEDSARVPWMLQTPPQRAGSAEPTTVSAPVSLADLFPTLADLCDVPYPDDLDGASLAEPVRDGEEPDRGPIVYDFLQPRFGEARQYRAIRDGRYKFVGFRGEPNLLFDLEADPMEEDDLAADPTPEVADVLDRFESTFAASISFEDVDRQRREDAALREEYRLDVPSGHGNAYHMPDDRLVDAETPLYQSTVLAESVASVFEQDEDRPE